MGHVCWFDYNHSSFEKSIQPKFGWRGEPPTTLGGLIHKHIVKTMYADDYAGVVENVLSGAALISLREDFDSCKKVQDDAITLIRASCVAMGLWDTEGWSLGGLVRQALDPISSVIKDLTPQKLHEDLELKRMVFEPWFFSSKADPLYRKRPVLKNEKNKQGIKVFDYTVNDQTLPDLTKKGASALILQYSIFLETVHPTLYKSRPPLTTPSCDVGDPPWGDWMIDQIINLIATETPSYDEWIESTARKIPTTASTNL